MLTVLSHSDRLTLRQYCLVLLLLVNEKSSVLRWSRGATAELFLLGNHSLYAVVHVLDEVNFRAAKSALVGDVVDVIGRLRVLTVDATNLNVEFVGDLLELFFLGS